jgi:hypothetical protein
MPLKITDGSGRTKRIPILVNAEEAARYAKAAARDKISVAEFARRAMDKEARSKR